MAGYRSGFSKCEDWFRLSCSEGNPMKAADMPAEFTTQSVIIRRDYDEEFFATAEIRCGDDLYASFGPTFWKGSQAKFGHGNTMNYHLFSVSGLYCPFIVKLDGRGISTPRHWPGYDGYCFVAERCEKTLYVTIGDTSPAVQSKVTFTLEESVFVARAVLFQRVETGLHIRIPPIPCPPEFLQRIVRRFDLKKFQSGKWSAVLFGRLDCGGKLEFFLQLLSPEGGDCVSGSVEVSDIALVSHGSDQSRTPVFD
jgi:hypothetical protein